MSESDSLHCAYLHYSGTILQYHIKRVLMTLVLASLDTFYCGFSFFLVSSPLLVFHNPLVFMFPLIVRVYTISVWFKLSFHCPVYIRIYTSRLYCSLSSLSFKSAFFVAPVHQILQNVQYCCSYGRQRIQPKS